MWFKTRVGLCRLPEAAEIRAWRSPNTGIWWIVAQGRRHPSSDVRVGLFFKAKTKPEWYYLACFRDGAGVQGEIAQAFGRIEAAVKAGAQICDLASVGSADAWEPPFTPVKWD